MCRVPAVGWFRVAAAAGLASHFRVVPRQVTGLQSRITPHTILATLGNPVHHQYWYWAEKTSCSLTQSRWFSLPFSLPGHGAAAHNLPAGSNVTHWRQRRLFLPTRADRGRSHFCLVWNKNRTVLIQIKFYSSFYFNKEKVKIVIQDLNWYVKLKKNEYSGVIQFNISTICPLGGLFTNW